MLPVIQATRTSPLAHWIWNQGWGLMGASESRASKDTTVPLFILNNALALSGKARARSPSRTVLP
jgi:hypothetical protein